MKSNDKILQYIGNFLILFSIASTLFILFPLIRVYFFSPNIKSLAGNSGTYITIPKIRAQSRIIEQVDPFDPEIYKQQLKKGVAHAKGTSLPGDKGTTYLFAHSSGPPWELLRTNTIFLRINELKQGDIIEIQRNKKVYKYVVRKSLEVSPTDTQYLTTSDKNDQLILQTCTPIGTDWNRLLVFAEFVKTQ